MLLTYNVANDEILFGFIDGGALVATATLSTDTRKTADEYAVLLRGILELRGFDTATFEGAICSSVVPTLTEKMRNAVELIIGVRPHVLGAGTKTGLRILTDDPTQLGADLVASSVGALTKYDGPMILVSLGAATAFSVIDGDGSFVGCAIAPGISLSAEALSRGASLLPEFAAAMPKRCIGTNTMESMQSGCIFGGAAMISGMIDRIERELGTNARVIVTGRDGERIASLCEREMVFDDTVLLVGLAKIYEKNQRKQK